MKTGRLPARMHSVDDSWMAIDMTADDASAAIFGITYWATTMRMLPTEARANIMAVAMICRQWRSGSGQGKLAHSTSSGSGARVTRSECGGSSP